MLHPVKYFLIFILLFSSQLFPQTIESIHVSGNKNFSEEEIIGWSEIKPGDKVFPNLIDTLKSKLALQFGNRGYFHCAFEKTFLENNPDSLKLKLSIAVEEGEPTYVNKMIITGLDSLFSLRIIPMFDYMKGRIFNKFELEENISSALSYFENDGYPFAKIIVSSIYFFSDTLKNEYLADIHLTFDKGINSRIDKIEISGNLSTKDYVILRELRLKTGEEYSQRVIDDISKKLNRLGYFEPVAEPQFFLNPKNDGVLRIEIKEKQTNNFDGIIGYIPGTAPGESGYLTGLVNVSLRNLFGTGRAAAIRWQQYNKSSQDLEIRYLEPWLFNYPFNFTGSFFQRKQDSSYVQRRIEGSIECLATENISASVFLSSEAVIPTQSEVPVFTVFNSNAVTTGINLKIDSRDDPYSPTEGILFLTSYSFSRKKIYGSDQYIAPGTSSNLSADQTNINLQRLTLDLNGFYELFNRQIIALGVHARELRGSFFEISDLFRLGGSNSLRGYQEDQFFGNRISWTNLEYRLLLTKRTFGFLFLDTGYYLRSADPLRNILKNEGYKIGYGLGFNVETNLGVLRVSFALAKGDSFSQGKIHFGIVNEF